MENKGYGSYQSSCKNKKPYDTWREAKNKVKEKKKRYGWHLRVYECIFCGYFHIGNNHQKLFKRINAGKVKVDKSVDKP